jgi:hypothetical protein
MRGVALDEGYNALDEGYNALDEGYNALDEGSPWMRGRPG